MRVDPCNNNTIKKCTVFLSVVAILQATTSYGFPTRNDFQQAKRNILQSRTWWGAGNGLSVLEKYFALPKDDTEDAGASLSSYLVKYASIHEFPRMTVLNWLFGLRKEVCLVPSLKPLGDDNSQEIDRIIDIIKKFKNLGWYNPDMTYQVALQKDCEDIRSALEALEKIRGIKDFNEKVVELRNIAGANLSQMQKLNANIYRRLYGYPVLRYLIKYPARLITLYWNYARAAQLYWNLTVRLRFLEAVQNAEKFKKLNVAERVV